MIVQKVLRSIPMRSNVKISTIEEMVDLKNIKIDQMLGTLTTYEMRVEREKSEPKEATFKVSTKPRSTNIIKISPTVNLIRRWLNLLGN